MSAEPVGAMPPHADPGSHRGPAEDHVAARVAWEMRRRGWSQERLASEMARAGYPLHQSAISKIVNPRGGAKRRTVSVDEAIGFAAVFGVPLAELTLPLEVVQGQDAVALMADLNEIENQAARLADKGLFIWARLAPLLADEEARESLAGWLRDAKGMSASEIDDTIASWVDRSNDRQAYLQAQKAALGVAGGPAEDDAAEHAGAGRYVPIGALFQIRQFIADLMAPSAWGRPPSDESVERVVTPIVHAGLTPLVAAVVNACQSGQPAPVGAELADKAMDEVDARIAAVGRMNAVTGSDQLEQLGARVGHWYLDGDTVTEISARTGETPDDIFRALKHIGLV